MTWSHRCPKCPAQGAVEVVIEVEGDSCRWCGARRPPSLELATFARAVEYMRAKQRAFFDAAPGSAARAEALRHSKAAEKRVDELVARALGNAPPEPVQRPLFGERRRT